MNAKALRSAALGALVVLMAVSVALPWLGASTGRSSALPPGAVLAIVKLLALAYLFLRVRRADTYAMQWSSMFILLFFAEGVVRATTDAHASAIAGGVQTAAAVVYFLVVLLILRPIKQHAREASGPR